jgi:hypothetical protein
MAPGDSRSQYADSMAGRVIAVPMKPALTPAVHEINPEGEGGFMTEEAA